MDDLNGYEFDSGKLERTPAFSGKPSEPEGEQPQSPPEGMAGPVKENQ